MMGSSQSQCGVCEKTFMGIFDEDIIMKCSRCGCIYCVHCAGLSKSQYEQIESSDGTIKWYCQFCIIEIKRNYEVICE